MQVDFLPEHGFVQAIYFENGQSGVTFVCRSGDVPDRTCSMEEDKDKREENGVDPEDNPDFIQEFIERKKLQNKVLQKLIDQINQNGHTEDLNLNNKTEES